jgi:hypothetical protein
VRLRVLIKTQIKEQNPKHVYPHHLGLSIPPQGVNGFILSDLCLPSWWWLLIGLHLVIYPLYHTLHPYRQLLIELILLKSLWLIYFSWVCHSDWQEQIAIDATDAKELDAMGPDVVGLDSLNPDFVEIDTRPGV